MTTTPIPVSLSSSMQSDFGNQNQFNNQLRDTLQAHGNRSLGQDQQLSVSLNSAGHIPAPPTNAIVVSSLPGADTNPDLTPPPSTSATGILPPDTPSSHGAATAPNTDAAQLLAPPLGRTQSVQSQDDESMETLDYDALPQDPIMPSDVDASEETETDVSVSSSELDDGCCCIIL